LPIKARLYISLAQKRIFKKRVIHLPSNAGYIGGLGNAIIAVRQDAESGQLSLIQEDAGADWASAHSYLSLSPNGKWLYSVCSAVGGGGSVMSFAVKGNGQLEMIGMTPSGTESGACHVHCGASHVYASHYGEGCATVYRRNDDGTLCGPIQALQFEGKGPHPQQDAAHIHFGSQFPDECVCFVDLGLDSVYLYSHHPSTGDLILRSTAKVALGTGARHLAHNSGHVYVVSEMAGLVSSFVYKDGTMRLISSQSALPEGYSGLVASSAIKIFKDLLIVGNRILNSIAVFRINRDGSLALKSHAPCVSPRDLNFSPDGKFVYVCGQDDDLVQVFKANHDECSLEPTGKDMAMERPSCIIFS
jgi:6-phosphogluconolactonase